jgi:hypothetical protein
MELEKKKKDKFTIHEKEMLHVSYPPPSIIIR